MRNKVACCYLTHEHPEVTEEVLGHIYSEYGKRGIDIYIYDSSEGCDTEKVVSHYSEKGEYGLYYIPVKFLGDINGGNGKYLQVLKGKGLKDHYDYIWPTKDRCWFEGQTLDRICDAIDEDRDVVFAVDERERFELITSPIREYYVDPVEFFRDYGALTTNWECLIRRTDTMLDPIDWDRYEKTFTVGADNNFNQTLTTFVRLSEMNDVSIKVIRSELDDRKYSNKAKPLWINNLFNVWIDKWIPAVYSLPSIYDGYKMSVIGTQLGHISLFGSNDSLIVMRDSGMLTPERVDMLLSMWGMISRIPKSDFERIISRDEKSLFDELYDEFLASFVARDYDRGYYLFIQNGWLADRLGLDKYRIISLSYYIYLMDKRRGGYSLLFEDVDSLEKLIENFEKYSV